MAYASFNVTEKRVNCLSRCRIKINDNIRSGENLFRCTPIAPILHIESVQQNKLIIHNRNRMQIQFPDKYSVIYLRKTEHDRRNPRSGQHHFPSSRNSRVFQRPQHHVTPIHRHRQHDKRLQIQTNRFCCAKKPASKVAGHPSICHSPP